MDNSQKALTEIGRLEEEIKQRKALLTKKKALLRKHEQQQARTLDTRRKILVGAIVLKKAESDPEVFAKLAQWLDEGLIEERNRALFPGLKLHP